MLSRAGILSALLALALAITAQIELAAAAAASACPVVAVQPRTRMGPKGTRMGLRVRLAAPMRTSYGPAEGAVLKVTLPEGVSVLRTAYRPRKPQGVVVARNGSDWLFANVLSADQGRRVIKLVVRGAAFPPFSDMHNE